MLLSLLVTSSQSRSLGAASRKTFNEEGGTIGRGKDKDWVLPDPNHHVSKSHASICFQQGAYYIVDTSTNGVFINDNSEPLGKNNRVKLNKGDCIYIGDYEIAVSLEAEEAMEKADEQEVEEEKLIDEGADDRLKDHSPALDEFFEPPAVSQEKIIPDNWNITNFPSGDEKVASKKTEGGERSASDSGEPMDHIPDDWELTGFSLGKSKKEPPSSERDKKSETEKKSPATPGTPEGEKLSSQQEQVRTPQTDDLNLLLRSIGLDSADIPPEIAKELPEIIGLAFREFVQGTMEVLMARSDLKSAFRVEQTMIKPAENNPLKFSCNVDAALENMLLKKSAGFLQTQEAVQESFQDIKVHQLAMMAGMQGALKGVLERFDPEVLEKRFALDQKGSKLLSVYKKSQFWEQYKELYKEIVGEAMDNFQRLLGEKFARSYEEQMKKFDTTGRKPSGKG